ncbi:flagellar hook-associated protein 3 FlgL [Quadrisphaera granulorum]|uniref:Flagellin n=1 Tax=Quadrisphaera granulorum TaxID=317664 RepID=A0A316ACY5_9ACTN|nr:flagellin [Quadrisphaera granulorum]PWJ55646.1 flagellar hook-associated protein 3 FlgL [Quadrisphaera granulorum]SZE95143.1 flagellar hook-associated protein 3 FlgL [Quadrisphaera granulorum]
MSGLSRVTHRTIQEQSLANLQSNLSAMATLSEQLSTGKRINRPSDDPTGTVDALRLRTLQRDNEQYGKNANDGLAWLGATDRALQSTLSQLNVATNRAMQALNSGTQNTTSRAALAAEVDGVLSAVKGMANSTYSDRNLFAGTATGDAVTATGTAPTQTFTWGTIGLGTVMRQIGPNDSVRVDTDGRDVFGDGATSVFKTLEGLAAAIRSGDDATTRTLYSQLQDRQSTVTTALTEVGARYNRVTAAQNAVADRDVELTKQLSDVQDLDFPKAVIAMQSQKTAYDAALQVTAKTLQTSLMDFIR